MLNSSHNGQARSDRYSLELDSVRGHGIYAGQPCVLIGRSLSLRIHNGILFGSAPPPSPRINWMDERKLVQARLLRGRYEGTNELLGREPRAR